MAAGTGIGRDGTRQPIKPSCLKNEEKSLDSPIFSFAFLADIQTLISSLTVCATAVMAASAAIQAVRHEFDFFGAVALAVVTAVGGGTLRDLLIGNTPVFWISDLTYVATAAPVGLALFTLVGASVALQADVPAVIAVLLGCVTGVAGGVIRDVLCGVQPSILKEDYTATISIAGGAVFVLTRDLVDGNATMAIIFVVMTIVRCVVIRIRETHPV